MNDVDWSGYEDLVLDEGMAYIRDLAPCQVEVWLRPEDLPPDVATVLAVAANRRPKTADGILSETIGDYQYTRAANSGAYFTPDEQRIIRKVAACGSGSLYSVPLVSSHPAYPMATEIDHASTGAPGAH